ncbi:hypothetical protein EJ03DRAFT_52343 [Teratosphaeria nubilosa]|uniref:Uncharacterized protein n=1 Tax=Teratosphaeria nubilosa TaxID=161662 RepID=A0A6G1LDN8_9PEZI|nr:hypothetical protein EJ03DRAFT_52343 [Teratosphaeria nubilosa]
MVGNEDENLDRGPGVSNSHSPPIAKRSSSSAQVTIYSCMKWVLGLVPTLSGLFLPFLLMMAVRCIDPALVADWNADDVTSSASDVSCDSILGQVLGFGRKVEDGVYEFHRAVFAPCATFWLNCQLGGDEGSNFWETYLQLSSTVDDSNKGWGQERPVLSLQIAPTRPLQAC